MHSLVDVGANDSVAENDVIAIAKYPDRIADVRSVDNHEITFIHLVTTGSVSLTTSGKVMLIMHQHSCHRNSKTIHSSPQIDH